MFARRYQGPVFLPIQIPPYKRQLVPCVDQLLHAISTCTYPLPSRSLRKGKKRRKLGSRTKAHLAVQPKRLVDLGWFQECDVEVATRAKRRVELRSGDQAKTERGADVEERGDSSAEDVADGIAVLGRAAEASDDP